MKNLLFALVMAAALLGGPLADADAGQQISISVNEAAQTENIDEQPEEAAMLEEISQINIKIGDYTFAAALEDNAAAQEFADMLRQEPVTIGFTDYSGFEKVGSLGRSLAASDVPTTTEAGDIVLYNSNNIVIFYGSNSWSYTRLGKVSDLTDWRAALGNGSVTAVFSLPEK